MPRNLFLFGPILLVAACAPGPVGTNNSVDINAAALQAQDAVDAYSENASDDGPVEIAEPDAATNGEDADNALAPTG